MGEALGTHHHECNWEIEFVSNFGSHMFRTAAVERISEQTSGSAKISLRQKGHCLWQRSEDVHRLLIGFCFIDSDCTISALIGAVQQGLLANV